MLKTVKFWGATLGAGVIIGFGAVGWMYAHRAEAAAVVVPSGMESEPSLDSSATGNIIPLDTSATPAPSSTPGLSVTSNGSQGGVLGDNTESSGTQDETSTPVPNASTLPEPSDFGQYNQYASNSTALYEDVKVGTGAAVASGSKVTVEYEGWLTNGTEFSATSTQNPTFSFTEGAGTVVKGWEEGIFGMKVGGERRLIIPPSQGYGDSPPAGSGIPANSVLVFDITLVSVQ